MNPVATDQKVTGLNPVGVTTTKQDPCRESCFFFLFSHPRPPGNAIRHPCKKMQPTQARQQHRNTPQDNNKKNISFFQRQICTITNLSPYLQPTSSPRRPTIQTWQRQRPGCHRQNHFTHSIIQKKTTVTFSHIQNTKNRLKAFGNNPPGIAMCS